MLAPAWLPSPDSSVFPVVSTMDRHALLFALYVTGLVGIVILFLFVAKKHRNNIGITPAWRFRTQETASLLAWVRGLCVIDNIQTADRLQVSALAFGVLSLCSHLELIDNEVKTELYSTCPRKSTKRRTGLHSENRSIRGNLIRPHDDALRHNVTFL
jgi:hypothetical protein